jgi:hypothetical protein
MTRKHKRVDKILFIADLNLYVAKHKGRNLEVA